VITLELDAASLKLWPTSSYVNNGHYSNNSCSYRVIPSAGSVVVLKSAGTKVHSCQHRNEAANGLKNDKYSVAIPHQRAPYRQLHSSTLPTTVVFRTTAPAFRLAAAVRQGDQAPRYRQDRTRRDRATRWVTVRAHGRCHRKKAAGAVIAATA
jgi:hypothetical protein